jgi:hypothetical protein
VSEKESIQTRLRKSSFRCADEAANEIDRLRGAVKSLLPWVESASFGGPDIEADITAARAALADGEGAGE